MVPLAALLIGSLALRDAPFREAAQTATAGLISLVPEGLVLLMSITYAAAAGRLAREGALVQQLNAVESLASADTVCLDKTGTLTDGTLELVAVVGPDGADPAAAVSLARRVAAAGTVRSPTSDAIASALGGGSGEEPRVEVGFSSRWKWSGVELADETIVLGAPEVLGTGEFASAVARHQEQRARVLVVGTAERIEPPATAGDSPPLPVGFTPSGLVVLRERMRPDAMAVVSYLRSEGVDLKIMSGDAPKTVEATAREAGFGPVTSISGAELPVDEALLAEAAFQHAVFARVSPEQKRALVAALQVGGRYVVMVGDGVNDVPAMKQANLAIALGGGSQIARGVSDIVLVGEDFGLIPRAISEGRRMLANLRRVAKLFVVKSAFAGTLILTVGVAGAAYPLLPRQLSLAALITVGIPAFALALAPSTGRPRELSFIRDLARFSVPGGVVSALAVLASYAATRSLPGHGVDDARTVAFMVTVLTGLYLILLLEEEAMVRSHVRAAGVWALMGVLILILALSLSIPALREFFALTPPRPADVAIAVLALVFALGALGLCGFRAPLIGRRIYAA